MRRKRREGGRRRQKGGGGKGSWEKDWVNRSESEE